MIDRKSMSGRLIEYDAKYDNGKTEKIKEQIAGFNKAFPEERIETLTIKDYVLGDSSVENNKNFSWWVEYGTDLVAALGGYASKHRLYINKNTGKYKYPNKYNDEQECFEDIKINLIKLYNLIENDRISDFESIDLPHNQSVKISYLLSSEKLIPVLNMNHLNKICSILQIEQESMNSLEKNRSILEYFRNETTTREWHTSKIAHFFYSDFGYNIKTNIQQSDKISDILVSKKQIILYGPPGTGKTFKTKKLSIEIINE